MMNRVVAEATQGGIGFTPSDVDVLVYNRSGSTLSSGDVVVFATLLNTVISNDGYTVSSDPGGPGSMFASVTKISNNTERQSAFVGVMLESVPDLVMGKCRVRGIATAKVYNSANSAIAIGSQLTVGWGTSTNTTGLTAILPGYMEAANSSTTANFGGDSVKILGVTLESISDPTSTGASIKVFFDGITGFGGQN